MANDDRATSHDPKVPRDASEPRVEAARRPYAKPALRRLGSVRELTQTTPSNGK